MECQEPAYEEGSPAHQEVGEHGDDAKEPGPVARDERHLQRDCAQQGHKHDAAQGVDVHDGVAAGGGDAAGR